MDNYTSSHGVDSRITWLQLRRVIETRLIPIHLLKSIQIQFPGSHKRSQQSFKRHLQATNSIRIIQEIYKSSKDTIQSIQINPERKFPQCQQNNSNL